MRAGQTAPNPVLSTIRYFRDEYEAHIRDKKTPRGRVLLKVEIDKELCRGCSLCTKVCSRWTRSRVLKSPFEIDQTKCIKCVPNIEKCSSKAISKSKRERG